MSAAEHAYVWGSAGTAGFSWFYVIVRGCSDPKAPETMLIGILATLAFGFMIGVLASKA